MSEPARPQPLLVPVSARQPLLDTMVSADEALRVILFETLAQVNANVPVVVAHNSEGLHQLRVGMRRLRTALRLTPSPVLAELDARAKVFINLVGTARDLDVFLDELFVPAVAELGSRRGFDVLAARAKRLRDGAWQSAVAQISSPEFRQFDEDVAAAARSVTWTNEPETAGSKMIRDVAPPLLEQALHRAKKRGRHFQELAPPKRHRLRITLKKLRYGAEFFAPLYPTKAVKRWVEPLKELQDMLGHLNDVAQVRGVLGRLLISEAESATLQADLSHAAGLLQGFHQARGAAFAHKTHKRWKEFRATEPFWV